MSEQEAWRREREELTAALKASTERNELLERGARSLHRLLEIWRTRLKQEEQTRAMRLRRAAVRWRSRIERRNQMGAAYPCVIGATGGSGTRVFARIAASGGLWIGGELNASSDALPIARFIDDWLLPYRIGGAERPPHAAPPGMDQAFASTLAEQFSGAPEGALGWKCPRSIYLLPFLAQRFPDLRFIHVVRDGRDMALSSNQRQLALYGHHLLPAEMQGWPEAERSIALWSFVNSWAADFGESLGDGYLRIRFEDLCARPTFFATQIFDFFELPGKPRRASEIVSPPESLGRWRQADPALVERMEAIGGAALERFGYKSS